MVDFYDTNLKFPDTPNDNERTGVECFTLIISIVWTVAKCVALVPMIICGWKPARVK